MRYLAILLLLLAGCRPATLTPPLLPSQSPDEIQTAAASTVEVLMRTATASQPAITGTPVPTPSPRPLPATDTPTTSPTARPAEFWITYVSQHRLWVSKQNGSMPTWLTNTPGEDFMPDWSPDGKYLAFLRFDATTELNGTMHVLPADSSTPRVLTPDRHYTSFAWLLDSRSLLAVSGEFYTPELTILDVTTGEARKVEAISGGQPLLSPDGKKIAVLKTITNPCKGEGCVPPNDLYVYDLTTAAVTRLTEDGRPKEELAWSPDGKMLSYHVWNTHSRFNDLVSADGSGVQADQSVPWWAQVHYQISPDGSQIAYATYTNPAGEAEVYVMPFGTDNSVAKQIAKLTKEDQGFDAYTSQVRWLPDGSGIVFNSWSTLYYVPATADISNGSKVDRLSIEMKQSLFDIVPAPAGYHPPPEPTAPAAWPLCPGLLDSRLDVGHHATVSTDPPLANNVREGSNKNYQVIGKIQPGEEVEILDGPDCTEGLIWWKVRSITSGLKGWTPEGDQKSYWLVPK